MNEWIEKSIELANGDGYLDNLLEIYPAFPGPERILPNDIERAIRSAVKSRDKKRLVEISLGLEKFPIEHPYVGCLRERPDLIEKNPMIVDIIGDQLLALGEDAVIKGCKAPKKISRRYGGMFQKWVRSKLGYKVFTRESLFEEYEGVAILGGSDNLRKKYANEKLLCNLERVKGPDLVAKVGKDNFIIGACKFITRGGGSQDNQFYEAIRFVKESEGRAIRIAILDGVVWFNENYLQKIKEANRNILSVLLLREFLENIGRGG